MEKIGIICEYNPFHNGHIYHINKIKEMYPNSLIILVLNGYFLERGEISVISKYDKTKIALTNKIDIVIELPVLFGTQSADTFAYYSVLILNELKVNKIIFGSESNNIKMLTKMAKESEDVKYNKKVKKYMDEGYNYPTALAMSLKTKGNLLSNDLLGISYIKAINQINKNIIPITIQRTNNYLDTESTESIVSASNIRNKIKNEENIDNYLPQNAKEKLLKIDYDIYFKILKSIIIKDNNLSNILDVDEGLEYRLLKEIKETNNFDDFIDKIKTKRYTYNRINRMLIHILLGIKKEDASLPLDYINILGFNKKGKNYLNILKKESKYKFTPDKSSKIYNYELKAAIFYDLITNNNAYHKELETKPIIN